MAGHSEGAVPDYRYPYPQHHSRPDFQQLDVCRRKLAFATVAQGSVWTKYGQRSINPQGLFLDLLNIGSRKIVCVLVDGVERGRETQASLR